MLYNILKSYSSLGKGFQAAKYPHLIFAIVMIFMTCTANAQWDKQSPVPTFLDVRGIGAPTTQRVFVATEDNSFDDAGSLFESVDGGATWIHRNIPFNLNNPFNGLFFLDSQNGWAFGNDNYRTTDGGTTWIQLQFLGSTYFMEFYTTSFGLAKGNFGRYVSHDSGDSWVGSPNGMFAFDFANDLMGLGISDGALYRTTDGGTTFILVYTGESKAVTFLTSTVAVGIVNNTFVRSTDSGMTWTTGAAAESRDRLLAVSADVVLAWGRTGNFPDYDDRILRSNDGGQTWTDLGEPIQEGIRAFAVADEQTLIASDLGGNMFRSSDAGLNWIQTFATPGPRPGFLSSAVPVFPDPLTGYFGYGNGFVIKTTDGGQSWSQISSGTGQTLNDLDRFTGGDLIAVGDNGSLLISNGSSPWILHDTFTTLDLAAVQVVDPDGAVVVDESGQVYKSADGGANWTAAGTIPPGISSAKDIHFSTLLDGWVIGFGSGPGTLSHTTDGGNTWTPVPDFMGAYVAVDVEGSNIWAANVTGRYYRSNDGGVTWIQGDLPGSPLQIQDMDFFDENIGYAVGWWGDAFRSEDGGATWQVLPTPNGDDQFTDIYLIGPNELWVSTTANVAYYSANGGLGWAVLDIGSSGFGNFSAIVASSVGEAWTVGFQGYIEHFAGPPPPPINQPPSASFDFSAAGLTVDYTDTSTDLDGTIVAWSWDFGDSTGSTLQHPTHTYGTANTYIVELVVTDDDGDTGGTFRIVTVQPNPGGTFGDFTEVTPLDSIFVTPQNEDFWVIATAPADYDSDGDLDIAVLGTYVEYNVSVEYKLILLRNNGPADSLEWDFSYIDVPLGMLSTGSSDLAWGDVDGDTDLDLVIGSDGETVIYRNDAGTLVLSDTELPGYLEKNDQADFDLRSITLADYDNDGDLDIFLPSVFDANSFSYRTALMRNDGPNGTGGWTFVEVDSVFAPTTHAQSIWADYDNDQDLDLLLVNIAPLTDEGFIRRYTNNGNGVFTGEDILGNLSVEHGEVQWGDYDGDGDLDILVAGNIRELDSTYTRMALRVYRNDAENYVPVEVIACIPCEGWFDLTAATWADYDSDGDMDILLAGTYNSGSQIEGRATIYLNDGTGFFTKSDNELPAPQASGTRGGTFSWFDLDGDGDLDYFIAGQYFVPGGNGLVEAQMHVYRNDVTNENNAPTTPTGLNVDVQSGNTVLFSWLPASDDHTPAPAITYDLVVVRRGKHVPTGYKRQVTTNDIITRLPEPGNISAVTEWALTELQDGQYEWRLQAVDAAYVGSFTAFGEFSIGVTTVDPKDKLPRVYNMKQNYPNPFNPTTKIKYSIPKDGLVTLKVYNAIGEEVATLVNEVKKAGDYILSFDASSLPSSIYFYRLQAGSFIKTMKMVLLR